MYPSGCMVIFDAQGGSHAEPDEAVLAHTQLPREVVEVHAIALSLDVHVGGKPFEGLWLNGRNGFLARGARSGGQQQGEECYFRQVFHKMSFSKMCSKSVLFEFVHYGIIMVTIFFGRFFQ